MLVRDKYRGTSEYTKARAELVRVARAKGLITYKDLAPAAGLPLVGNNMARRLARSWARSPRMRWPRDAPC